MIMEVVGCREYVIARVNEDESETSKHSHTKSYLMRSADKAYGPDLK